MTRRKLILTIAALAAAASPALVAAAPGNSASRPIGARASLAASETAAAGTLAVITGNGTENPSPGLAVHDFGVLSMARTEPIEHDFSLRNDGAAPVTLDHIQAACGCTNAVANGILPGEAILPGKTIVIHVAVDPGHLGAGPASKMAWVYLKGQPAPAATLEMSGSMKALVVFSPSLLDFGKVDAGREKTLSLSVTGDAQLIGSLLAPVLSPPNPDVTFVRSAVRPGNGGQATADYLVALSKNARIGQLQSTIAFTAGSGPSDRLSSAFASLVGEVTGEIAASPSTVAFGSVTKGKSAVQQIMIDGSLKVVSGLSAHSPSPYVTAKIALEPPRPRNSTGKTPTPPFAPTPISASHSSIVDRAILRVTLSDKTPAGVLQTEVVVETADGQQLALPVWVFVEDAAPPRK